MTNEEILREINSLPLEAQRQIKDFVFFSARALQIVAAEKHSAF